MGPKDGPVACEVVEVVHDDSHKEVNDLRAEEGHKFGFGQGQALSRSPGRGTAVAARSRAALPADPGQGTMQADVVGRRPPLEPGDAVGHPRQRWAPHPRRSRGRLQQAQCSSSLPTLAKASTDTPGRQDTAAVGRN